MVCGSMNCRRVFDCPPRSLRSADKLISPWSVYQQTLAGLSPSPPVEQRTKKWENEKIGWEIAKVRVRMIRESPTTSQGGEKQRKINWPLFG